MVNHFSKSFAESAITSMGARPFFASTNGIRPSETPFITFGIVTILELKLFNILLAFIIFPVASPSNSFTIGETTPSLTNSAVCLKNAAKLSL